MNWYKIENNAKKADTADIYIYSEVGGYDVNAKSFIEELQNHKDKNIDVHINSLGGSVFDGLAIYNALKNHTKKVTTKVEGIAASIASVIAMAGDTIEMAENSLFMIHNPFAMSGGDANELRKTANILDKIRNEIAGIYASKSNHDSDHYVNLMDVETWFNSNETLELGLINSITTPLKIENNYDVSNFTNISNEKINAIINQTKIEKMENKEIQNENVENVETTKEIQNDSTLIGKIKSMLGVSNEHEEGHDESLAEETDWAKTYEEMKDKVDNLEKAVHEIEVQLGMKQDEIENKQKELDNANAEIQNKVDELAKLKAGKTDVTPNNDPSINNETAVDPNAAFFNAMVKSIQRKA
jgi:ATP-dependent Clp endopeptidase proteolytic subunit ClpP